MLPIYCVIRFTDNQQYMRFLQTLAWVLSTRDPWNSNHERGLLQTSWSKYSGPYSMPWLHNPLAVSDTAPKLRLQRPLRHHRSLHDLRRSRSQQRSHSNLRGHIPETMEKFDLRASMEARRRCSPLDWRVIRASIKFIVVYSSLRRSST